jgi:PAS domain S-box-containing protein
MGIFLDQAGTGSGNRFAIIKRHMVYNEDTVRGNTSPPGRSEEQYHKMVEEVEDYAILMLDSNGIIRNWNKGAEKIKGYTEKEIVGNHFRVFYTPEDQAAGLPEKLVAEAIQTGKAVHEGWRVRKDRTTFWGSIVITALHDNEGRILGFSKVTRDLTERKLAEDKLVQYARLLEAQNKELQQFAYAAAHDMKEPLRKVQFYYSAIREEGTGGLSDKQQAYLQRSSEAAARMQRLIEDLLAFTNVAEPGAQFEPIDLGAMMAEVSAFYQEALDQAGGTVMVSALPMVRGSSFHMHQLFVNLFGNAIKYRQQDRPLKIEVTGSIVNNPGLGEVETYLPMRFLKIAVKDNGIGFETEHAERIFDMFERLHGRQEYEGTGIGLSICRRIMDNHKGHIRARGYPGEGAVFELFFPA